MIKKQNYICKLGFVTLLIVLLSTLFWVWRGGWPRSLFLIIRNTNSEAPCLLKVSAFIPALYPPRYAALCNAFPCPMSDIVDQLIFCGGCNVVSVVGIVGNSFSLLVMYPRKYSETKGLFYGYLSALAVADILFLIINIVYRF